MDGFADLNLSTPVRDALEHMGYEAPSPVQAETIPLLLAGRDVIAQALTGTGKTAAFGIPIAERADPSSKLPQALVLTPTRELAIQVAGEISRIGHTRQLCVLPIYGGQPYDRQLRVIRQGVQVVVATPGRLLDLLERKALQLGSIAILILDEADEMLNMGFLEDVESIMAQLPGKAQTALFSATMPGPVAALARKYMSEPVRVTLSKPQQLTAPEVTQYAYEVPRPYKIEALTRLLDVKDPELALVFCATKRMVDELAEELQGRGYRTEAIHGDISQAQRERVIQNARRGRLDILVATDLAARGLDITNITHVVNFDLPQDSEYYVHRVGRTGRAGRSGEALTLVAPWERRELKVIERATGAPITMAGLPSVAELDQREKQALAERLENVLESDDWMRYQDVVGSLSERHDLTDIAAAALSVIAGPRKPRKHIPPPEAQRDGRPERWKKQRVTPHPRGKARQVGSKPGGQQAGT